MKKKILGMFVCLLLVATAVPTVESLRNNAINSTVPSIPLTSMETNWTEMQKLLVSNGAGAIFVSTAGSDTTGNGTIGNPFATVQKGINVAQPGDTVYVRGGVYNQLASFVRSGTEGNPITLKAYGNEIATMDGRNFTIAHRQGIIDDQWYSYINIFNMNVQYSDECGISVRDGPCGYIRIEGCSTYDTDQSGICSYGGDTTPYKELHNITIKNNKVGKSVMDMSGQEAITIRFTRDFEVSYNYLYNMGNIGIDAKNGSSYGSIHHNTINQSGADNLWVSSAIYIDSGCWSLNRVCHNVDIYDNLIHGHCNGIKIGCESGGRVENCSIYNNIVYEARVGFRDDNNGLTDGIRYIKNNVKVINNNFINCNWSVFITEPGQNIKNLTLRNNIMSSINNIFQWNTPPSPEEVNNDHNLYEKDPGVSFRGTDYIIGNPGFVNEAAHDYRLTEYSMARNNGSSVNAPNFDYIGTPRPQGSEVDIGAYEYIGSNVVPSFGTPNPANNSNDNPLSLTWSIPISDANGDTFNWTVNCSNGQHNSANGASNGTKSLALSGLTYLTTYKVWVNATDFTGSGLYTRKWYTFATKANHPPNPPSITGPAKGKVGVATDYNFMTIDPNEDEVYYFIDWGDTTNSGWIGPYPSGEKITESYTWSTKGTYTVNAKAKDIYGNESDWATLTVSMPCSIIVNTPCIQFLQHFIQSYLK